LTYKTVRSCYRPCYPLPNWYRIEGKELPYDPNEPLTIAEPPVIDSDDVTWTVSFGMPSMSPDDWRPDVQRAKESLNPGQILIVSVVGTPTENGSEEELAEDFAQCAAWAVASGADVVEANFSCPNVCSAEGQIYQNASSSQRIAARIQQSLGGIPLLIKTGAFAEKPALEAFLNAVAPVCQGVVLVNGVQRRVHRPDGSAAFSQSEWAGILGRAIHSEGVRLVEAAVEIARRQDLNLSIAGVGGVFNARDVADYFDAGAQAVFAGGAPMTKPKMAVEIKQQHPEY
jgi:dihydroorotate dehydrogenase